MSPLLHHPLHLAPLLLAAFLLPGSASADPATASRYYEDAVKRNADGDPTGAILQLKNALLEQADLLPALLLLGETYLNEAQAAEAETALTEAERLGADRSLVVPLLARSWLQQFKHEQLLGRLQPEGLSPQAASELLVLRGQALIETHRVQEATQSFLEAARLLPDAASPHLGLAKVKMQQGELDGAALEVAEARKRDTASAEVWNITASLAHVRGDLEQAVKDYDQALAINPAHREARVAKVSVLLDLKRSAEAGKELDYLLENAPRDPRAAYLRALNLARAGDEPGSRAALAEAVSVLDSIRPELIERNTQLLLLAGLVNHGLKQTEKAKSYLERALAVAPELVGARKLLGSMLLQEGRADQAMSVLTEAERQAGDDPEVLSLLASAYMARGLHDRAAGLLRRAMELSPSTSLQTQLGVARIEAGDTGLGRTELAAAFAANPDDPRAGLLLALQLIESGRAAEALPIARKLVQREPGNPTLLNIQGTAESLAGDDLAARTSFEAAVASDNRFLPAQINLARLREREGRPDEARLQLETLAREFPDDRELLLARSRLARRSGQNAEAARLLDRLRALAPDDVAIRVEQIDLEIEAGAHDRAIKAAQDLAGRFPEDLSVLETLGRAQVAGGQEKEARVTFRRMADRAGFDAQWQLRIAARLRSIGADEEARYALQKATQADPSFLEARVDLIVLELETRHADRALELVQKLRRDYPESALALQLAGDARLATGDAPGAETDYRAAFAKAPTLAATVGLSRALTAQARPLEAIDVLEAWRSGHPDDEFALMALAELQAQQGESAKAIAALETLLARYPENPNLLNNLANLLAASDPERALKHAREALRVAPQIPAILDTLGWLLVNQGGAEEGIRYLREARSREVGDATIGYHLAHALHQLGRTDEARTEIERSLATTQAFPDRKAAEALKAALATSAAKP
jgi:cellulose synthase operon protein C